MTAPVELIETYWPLTPDERIIWIEVLKGLDLEVAAKTVVVLANANRQLPSEALFLAAYRGMLRVEPERSEPPRGGSPEWFSQQRAALRREREWRRARRWGWAGP